jgi:tRNA pseudouridine38-40 synthase
MLLTIAYDGSLYAGWQRQPNAPTIQETLESALFRLYKTPVAAQGASRTDAGVHAAGQRAAFDEAGGVSVPTDKLPYALNTFLPDDIRATAARIVPDGFDPIRSAKQKTYEYRIYNGAFMDPCLRRYAEHIRAPLDMRSMRLAAAAFVGERDFAAFRAAGGSARTTVRRILALGVSEAGGLVTIRVTGNGFLYNMVRIIAGTLVYAGTGKLRAQDVPGIIESRDRARAGKTLAAKGLTLVNIDY